ncbi:relaxase domain-containing protein, partial [Acinetobacter sp. ULE_I064]|uniref:relaxase domain-containing protein n=1 Tax=Acinetobacter sp. ULE_I064 TaxID=3373071 RepID=UPI003AF80779
MISQKVLTRGDAGNASVVAQIDSYYQDKEDDYYSREDQPSQWQGKLAEELNLTGEVSKLDFVMLMQGQHNGIDLRKSKYTKKDNKDRLGID